MQISPDTSFSSKFKRAFTNKDYYKISTGAEVSAEKGTGKVEYTDNGIIKVYDAQKVSVYGTKGDDKIIVKDSSVNEIYTGSGDNKTLLDNCTFKTYSNFWGTGSIINTGGSSVFSYDKTGSDIVKINGDFNGCIQAQQGNGKGYGDDSKAHKDTILINGNNTGRVEIDSKDKVAVKGEKGDVVNTTVFY